MNYLTADDTMLDWLRGIVEPVEIRDPDGKVLGHYAPILSRKQEALYARAAELFDLEEMERIAATEHSGCTFAEEMEHLRSLEQPK